MDSEENKRIRVKFECCDDTYSCTEKWDIKMKGKAHCFGCNDRAKAKYKILKDTKK